jgi:hypothetical protein
MGGLADKLQEFLFTSFGIPEELGLFVIVVPVLILAVYVNYKK